MQAGTVIAPRQSIQGKIVAAEPVRLDALTSLRFVAALMIVLLHFDQIILQSHGPFFLQQMALQQAVSLFYVLSGFILFYRYPALPSAAACKKFFVARFARIYPAHIISTLLFMLAVPSQMWAAGKKTIWLFLATASMVQSLIPNVQYYYAINTPAWSISTEFGFYLLFPLLIYRWRETRVFKLVACAALLLAFLCFAEHLRAQPMAANVRHLFLWSLYVNPFVRLIEFVTGMFAANLFLFVRSKFDPSTAKISAMQVVSLVLVGLSIVAFKMHSDVPASQELPQALAFWAEGSGGFLAYALLVFAMSFSKGIVARVFAHPCLVFLGEISFSTYLVHWMVIELLLVQNANHAFSLGAPLLWSIYLGSIFILSVLMHLFAEKPLRKLITNAFAPRTISAANVSVADAKAFYQSDGSAKSTSPAGKV